jgi:phosphoribosylamine-glycine ligase
MLIYNVTSNVDESIHDQWMTWMTEKHIPEMIATGKFVEARMTKVLVEEEMGGITYSVQYMTKDRATLNSYFEEFAPKLIQEGVALFGGKVVTFRTELEVVKIFS